MWVIKFGKCKFEVISPRSKTKHQVLAETPPVKGQKVLDGEDLSSNKSKTLPTTLGAANIDFLGLLMGHEIQVGTFTQSNFVMLLDCQMEQDSEFLYQLALTNPRLKLELSVGTKSLARAKVSLRLYSTRGSMCAREAACNIFNQFCIHPQPKLLVFT